MAMEIVELPIEMVIFHSYATVYQRVSLAKAVAASGVFFCPQSKLQEMSTPVRKRIRLCQNLWRWDMRTQSAMVKTCAITHDRLTDCCIKRTIFLLSSNLQKDPAYQLTLFYSDIDRFKVQWHYFGDISPFYLFAVYSIAWITASDKSRAKKNQEDRAQPFRWSGLRSRKCMDRASPASLEGVDQSLGREKNWEIHRKKWGNKWKSMTNGGLMVV